MNDTEFINMPSFDASWTRLGYDDDDLKELQDVLLANPEVGDIIVGAGGVRKLRFTSERQATGKSHASRVCYYYVSHRGHIFLIDAFAKKEKSNLSQAERNVLSKITAVLKRL